MQAVPEKTGRVNLDLRLHASSLSIARRAPQSCCTCGRGCSALSWRCLCCTMRLANTVANRTVSDYKNEPISVA
eukprot:362607-Chlamydomonas_euryale.AAC.18